MVGSLAHPRACGAKSDSQKPLGEGPRRHLELLQARKNYLLGEVNPELRPYIQSQHVLGRGTWGAHAPTALAVKRS